IRRSAGAIFRDSRPATIIKSDWRGLPRNTSAPNRAISYRPQLIAIISIAQHARPKVTGQIDDRRAHCTIFSTVVVNTGMSNSDSRPMSPSALRCQPVALRGVGVGLVVAPVEGALAPDIHVSGEEQGHEQQHLH